jgi:hypothetical protein
MDEIKTRSVDQRRRDGLAHGLLLFLIGFFGCATIFYINIFAVIANSQTGCEKDILYAIMFSRAAIPSIIGLLILLLGMLAGIYSTRRAFGRSGIEIRSHSIFTTLAVGIISIPLMIVIVFVLHCSIVAGKTREILTQLAWQFDWGIYKRDGWLILFLSSSFYVACLVGEFRLLRRIRSILCSTRITVWLGIFLIGPTIIMACQSIRLQESSAHYQESTHIPAFLVSLASFGLTLVLWFALRAYKERKL